MPFLRDSGTLLVLVATISCSGPGTPPVATVRSGSQDAAAALSATSTVEPEREAWSFETFPGERITTPNYRIHTTATNPRFLEVLPQFYEQALRVYTSELGDLPRPESRMETFLFQSRDQWLVKTQELLGGDAAAFRSLGRGGFTTRGTAVLYYLDWASSRSSRDTFALASHEGWHQYTQRTFKHHLPVWLEEGIATYMESFSLSPVDGSPRFRPTRNRERLDTLKQAVRRHRLIPMDELLTRTPRAFLGDSKERLLAYYAQVWALSRFLLDGEDGRYRAALEEVLQDAAEGRLGGRLFESSVVKSKLGNGRQRRSSSQSGAGVVLEYFNPDLDEFGRQYDGFIRQLLGTDRE